MDRKNASNSKIDRAKHLCDQLRSSTRSSCDLVNACIEWIRENLMARALSGVARSLVLLRSRLLSLPQEMKKDIKPLKEEDKRYCLHNPLLSFFDMFTCVDGVAAYFLIGTHAESSGESSTPASDVGTSKEGIRKVKTTDPKAKQPTAFAAPDSESIGVCSFSFDGSRFAVCYVLGKVIIWDTNHGTRVKETSIKGEPVSSVSFSGKGNSVLLMCTKDYTWWKWDIDASCSNLTTIYESATSSKIDGEVICRRSNFYNSGESLLLSSIINSRSGAVLEISASDLSETILWRSYSVDIRKNYVISRTVVSQDGNGILVGLMDKKLVESYCLLWPNHNQVPANYKKLDKGTIGSWSVDGNYVVTWIMTDDLNSNIDDGNSAFIWNVKVMRDNLTNLECSCRPITITNPFGDKVFWCQITHDISDKDQLIMGIGGEFVRFLFWDIESKMHTHTIETGISTKEMMLFNKEAWIEAYVNQKSVKGLCPIEVTKDGSKFGGVLGMPNQVVAWDTCLGIEIVKVSPKDLHANHFKGGIDLMGSPSNRKFAIVGKNGVMVFCPPIQNSDNKSEEKGPLEAQMVQFDNPSTSRTNVASYKMSFSGDGDSLGVLCVGLSKMYVWNLPHGTSCKIVSNAQNIEEAHIQDFCLSKNGKYLAIYIGKCIHIMDCNDKKVAQKVGSINVDSEVDSMGIRDDACEVVVCMKDGRIYWYDGHSHEDIPYKDENAPTTSIIPECTSHTMSLMERIRSLFKRPNMEEEECLIENNQRECQSTSLDTSINISYGTHFITYTTHVLAEELKETTFQLSNIFDEVIRISETKGVEAWDLETKDVRLNGVGDVAHVKRSSHSYSGNSSLTESVMKKLEGKQHELLRGTSIDMTEQTTLIQSSNDDVIVAGNSCSQSSIQRIDRMMFDVEYNEANCKRSHSVYVVNLKGVEYRRKLSGESLAPEKGLAISHDGRYVACLAGKCASKLVVWNVYASEQLLPDYNFLSLNLFNGTKSREVVKQEIINFIELFGINFFMFLQPSGMSILHEAIYQFNKYLLKVILHYVLKKKLKVSFLCSNKAKVWAPTSKYHNVIEVAVAGRSPKTLTIILKYLLKRVTHETEVIAILTKSLECVLQVYPDIFIRTIRESKMLRPGMKIEVPESTLDGRKFKAITSNSMNLSEKEMKEFWTKYNEDNNIVSTSPQITNGATIVPIENACSFGFDGFLRNLLICKAHDSAYGSFIVRAIVDYKWRSYAKNLLVEELAHHCVVSLSFTVYCFVLMYGGSNKIDPNHEHEEDSDLKNASLLVCLVLAVPCLYRELWQCIVYTCKHGLRGFAYWLTSAWNWIEVFSYINVVFIIPLGQWMFLNEGHHRKILSALVAVESLLIWSRILFYARPFDHTGPLVVTISAIVNEICYFLILALSVMYGFALAFCVLYRHHEPKEADILGANMFNYVEANEDEDSVSSHEAFGTFWRSFFTVFSYTFGDFEMDVLYNAPEPVTALILFVLYVVIIAIILLNMLIALMSEKFAHISEKRKSQVIKARARAIDDIDSMLSDRRKEKLKEKIGRYLQVIIPTHHHERVTKPSRLRQTQSKLKDDINEGIKKQLHAIEKNVVALNLATHQPNRKGLTSKNTTQTPRKQFEPSTNEGSSSIIGVKEKEEERWYDTDGTDSNFSISYSDEDVD